MGFVFEGFKCFALPSELRDQSIFSKNYNKNSLTIFAESEGSDPYPNYSNDLLSRQSLILSGSSFQYFLGDWSGSNRRPSEPQSDILTN